MQSSSVAQAKNLLDDTHVASKNGVSLVIGSMNATKLAKLASVKGVVSVTSVEFKQTASPTGNDPEIGNQPAKKTRNDALRAFQKNSVPFDKAPPLKTSNFDQLKKLNVLDAKTHNFTGAWNAGYTGTGRHRLRPRRRHRLGPPRPDRHLADVEPGRRRDTAPTRAGSAGRRRSTRTARSCCWPRRR